MSAKDYRVYRVGEDEPVRLAGRETRPEAEPFKAPSRSSRSRAERPRDKRGGGGIRRWPLLVLILALLAAAAVLLVRYGGEMPGNVGAAYSLAKSSGKVPTWLLLGAPVGLGLLLLLVSLSFALTRRKAIKALSIFAVIVFLGVPGVAVGWVNGMVSQLGDRSDEVKKTVAHVRKELRPELPSEPVTILLIGSDKSRVEKSDPGRSDSQILIRMDPATKSISMLSLPRDLRVDIPGVGYNKLNTAYSYGKAAGMVKVFHNLTGVPINHFIEINFLGFERVVNILGGVYIPVDRRYYNPQGTGWKSINQEPGYQLLNGHHALDFVRFRHDQRGDFTRMQRQQLFLKELQRQSGRWNGEWTKVVQLVKAVTAETTSDIDSLKRLQPLVELGFQVDTSKINTVHLEGDTPMIDGVSYVVASQEQIAEAVHDFSNPHLPPRAAKENVKEPAITKKMYTVRVSNASGIEGRGAAAASQLKELGYTVEIGTDAPEFPGSTTTLYAPNGLAAEAKALSELFSSSTVKIVTRSAGSAQRIDVFVTSSFSGALVGTQAAPAPSGSSQPTQLLKQNANFASAEWKAFAAKASHITLMRPTAWCTGFSYDEFYNYKIKTTTGANVDAAVAVVKTPTGNYWNIQALRWLKPPAIENPTSQKVINGTTYLLFTQGKNLHMVAWKRGSTLYWVLNTINNELSNDTLLGIATSCVPVK